MRVAGPEQFGELRTIIRMLRTVPRDQAQIIRSDLVRGLIMMSWRLGSWRLRDHAGVPNSKALVRTPAGSHTDLSRLPTWISRPFPGMWGDIGNLRLMGWHIIGLTWYVAGAGMRK